VPALAAHLERRTAVLVGHSGVGKSSLLNALDPDAAQVTAAVRDSDGRGRHTTTAALLRELPGGGRLIDTPGVREFGLGDVRRDELDAAFPDVAAHAASCRFDDCVHGPEPGCAVRAAVGVGELPAGRLAAWRRILLDP
jgi:ribosome biogenesis GTPase